MTDARKRILVFGPPVSPKDASYGDGAGGYTRKMHMYLEHFRSDRFQLHPCFHTVRTRAGSIWLLPRLARDVACLLATLLRLKPHAMHILGQYRMAIPREFLAVRLAHLFRCPVVYEIKGGQFISWYRGSNPVFRAMARFVIQRSTEVLSQGMPYVEFLRAELAKESQFHPNFVPTAEISSRVATPLAGATMRVLFVGYACRDKGVFELVEACRQVASRLPVRLTVVGAEHPDFSRWADQQPRTESFQLVRTGKLPHAQVLEHFSDSDVYCYPTRHAGEGHNNTINEAMMQGLVVVASKAGFLESLLAEGRGYLLPGTSSDDISRVLLAIAGDRDEARGRARRARQFVCSELTSDAAFARLTACYERLCAGDEQPPGTIRVPAPAPESGYAKSA